MRALFGALALLSILYILGGLLLFINQRNFLYYPTPVVDHPHTKETFNSQNESINVIVLNPQKEKAIIYFGGNGETVALTADKLLNTFPSHTVYLVNYRGYGESSGTPTEKGLYADALNIYDQVKSKHLNISIIGRSLGSGIATYLASKRPTNKLVLIAPFDSIQNVAQSRIPIYPLSLLLKDKYDSLSRIKNIQANILFLVAKQDQVIPFNRTKNLIQASDKEKGTVRILKNGGHNSISDYEEYYLLLNQFIESKGL